MSGHGAEHAGEAAAKAELDALMGSFMDAFTNTGGRPPRLHAVREVFIPQGMIIMNLPEGPVVYDLDTFLAPRQAMLTDGTLTEFSEWETAERTEIFGSVAHRYTARTASPGGAMAPGSRAAAARPPSSSAPRPAGG
ncbi:DUF4440 domain-containing protein [Streptomyces albus]|nr:DUF4440 domain-containing protein [Streptomyces albus]